jgi:putative ABC transport system permease protein
MLRNYLISAYRILLKTKAFTLINIMGLAIGMAACLLILHYVNFERGFDRFHENFDRIYRLRYERIDQSGQAVRFASCCPPAAARIRGNYPEVEKIARILRYQAIVSYRDLNFLEERMYFAEPDFLSILKFKFIEGDPLNGIRESNTAFISQSTAKKYFGNEDPLNQTLSVNNKTEYKITGIFEDIPQNSHLKFDILLPWENLASMYGPDYTEAWGHTGSYTYLIASPGTDPRAFEKKLLPLVEAECPWLDEYNMTIDLKMQPLADIHLTSHYMQEYEVNGDKESVDFLFIIAFFIIIMAWVNYVNLSTARSLSRARSVGMRKVVGASRWQLIAQFFLEVVIINLIAIVCAMVLIDLALPYFSGITGVPPDIRPWSQTWFWQTVSVMFFAGLFLSGLYPVVALTSFKPISVLRGKLWKTAGGINLRKALVVMQFVVGLFLIIATLTIYKQLIYMRSQKLGFDMNQILVVKAPRVRDDTYISRAESFKETLLQRVDIEKISFITEVPGRQIYWDAGAIHKAGDDAAASKNYQIVGVDYEFIDLFDLKFAAGRNFSRDFPADENALILNETAVGYMGFESPERAVGQKVDYWGEIYPIIGVLKDFHQQSLKVAFEPHIYRFIPYGQKTWGMVAMKVNSADMRGTIDIIIQKYDEFFPGNPFQHFFLDSYYNEQYRSDELFGKVYGIFSMLAIFVAVLGIYGLSSYSISQLKKEIGIRKILGASISRIVGMLTGEFLILIAISTVVAWPVAYYTMDRWLESFAFRSDIGTTIFLLAGLLTMSIALLTIGYQVIRAAVANPVDAIQRE